MRSSFIYFRVLPALVLLIGLSVAMTAQNAVHFDRPFHVAGEVSWFSLYTGATTPPKVRVTVSDPAGKVLDYFFIARDNAGQLDGYYRWPFTLATGYYSLAFDALAADGTVKRLGRAEHAVYSDQRVETDKNDATTQRPAPVAAAGGLKLRADDGRISVEGLNGDAYSVSVYNADVMGARTQVLEQVGEAVEANWVDTLFYEAKVGLADGSPVQTNLLPVFDPATFTFGFAKTDADGSFVLQTGAFTGGKKLQVRSLDDAELRPAVIVPSAGGSRRKPVVTKQVADYIDLARRRRKIYQLYATVETEIDATVTPQTRRPITPNKDWDVQDYKQFPDMYTFFKEVGGELRVRLKKENYSARLYNAPNQRFFQDTPLYIVDGKLTTNSNYVNTLSPSDVTYLGYYWVGKDLRRDFPALGNNGVVQIETVRPPAKFPERDAAAIFGINGLQPEATFQARTAASDVPALSPLLLWETGGGQAAATIDLPTTDDFGTYMVVVVARGEDGKLRSANTTIEKKVVGSR